MLTSELVLRNAYLNSYNNNQSLYYYSVGVHPWFTNHLPQNWHLLLKKYATANNVLAVGECGFDRYKGADLHTQLEVFKQHIAIANNLNKPLIVHLVKCRDLFSVCLQLIKVPVVLHGFNGSFGYAKSLLLHPQLYFSLGNVLFKSPEKASALLQTIPLNRLFLETDNNAITIDKIYVLAAGLKGITVELLQQKITENAHNVFIKGILEQESTLP